MGDAAQKKETYEKPKKEPQHHTLIKALQDNDKKTVSLCVHTMGHTHINATTNNITPLPYAVEHCTADIVALLLYAEADPNKCKPETGESALHLAVERGSEAILALLLATQSIIVDAVIDHSNSTALHLAVEAGKPNMVNMLLMKEAKRSIRDKNGKTAADLARASEAPEAEHIRALFGIFAK